MESELEFEDDGQKYVFTLQYIDVGCGETKERCDVMKKNLEKILEDNSEGMEYTSTWKSCENYS